MLHLPGFAQVITSAWDSLPVHPSTSIFPTCSHPPGKHSEPIWNHGGPFLCSGHSLPGLITCISVKNGLISVFTSMHHLFLLPDRWITQGVFKKHHAWGPALVLEMSISEAELGTRTFFKLSGFSYTGLCRNFLYPPNDQHLSTTGWILRMLDVSAVVYQPKPASLPLAFFCNSLN